jgi:DNA gyrase/topoisomerase IV subunit B
MGKTEQYVYDLETENHHFQAGIGQMIVHNTDGSHIKGLIINMFQHFWPELLQIDGFIQTLSTPLIKIFKKVLFGL